MDPLTRLLLTTKILQRCDAPTTAAIYSQIYPTYNNLTHKPSPTDCSFQKIIEILATTIQGMTGEREKGTLNRELLSRIQEQKEEMFKKADALNSLFVKTVPLLPPSDEKIAISLALALQVYLEAFIRPVQAFLPDCSLCSGQWDFWDHFNILALQDALLRKEDQFLLRKAIKALPVWKRRFSLDQFPAIVRSRLTEEELLDKGLDQTAMLKSVIIRAGELGSPHIPYEVIDLQVRRILRHLNVNRYLRIDREILFLRQLEEELLDAMAGIASKKE